MLSWARQITLGDLFDVNADRNLVLLKDSRIIANCLMTTSIRGRSSGRSLVMEAIKLSMNSKPRYFYGSVSEVKMLDQLIRDSDHTAINCSRTKFPI